MNRCLWRRGTTPCSNSQQSLKLLQYRRKIETYDKRCYQQQLNTATRIIRTFGRRLAQTRTQEPGKVVSHVAEVALG
jgi:hypothetical protein